MSRTPDIQLNAREQELLGGLSFDMPSHQTWPKTQQHMTELAERLLERKAISDTRLRYFTDPECNPGGRGKSRKDVFEKNGTRGDEILRHPHFLKYLEYFLYGPNLPSEIVVKFKDAAASLGHLSGSDVLDLAAAAGLRPGALIPCGKAFAPFEPEGSLLLRQPLLLEYVT